MKLINKISRRGVALFLSVVTLVISLCACSSVGSVSNNSISENETGGEKIDEIYAMVCSAVETKLNMVGFNASPGIATTIENKDYNALGVYYYSDEFDLIGSDELKSVGFVEVAYEKKPFFEPSSEESIISVVPVDETDEEQSLVCTYSYSDIGASHFVYKNKYITYYQQTPMRVVYSVKKNDVDYYDLSLGSLYDYDHGEYIYDESLLDEYKLHSGVSLYSEEDYEAMEKYLQKLSKEQYKAGFYVTDFTVAYISPENLQAYLDSEEEDTFFGYSVNELTEAFGKGTALKYTDDGFQAAEILSDNEYDWKTFLSKIGVGCGIIIVGAVLTPITGGASFGCALITITECTVGFAVSATLGEVAIDTVKDMMNGQSLMESLQDSKYDALDSFSNNFIIGAGISSIGVLSGIVKPSACFVAGTEVAVLEEGKAAYKPIECIKSGDYVLSYDIKTKENSYEIVKETYVRSVYDLCRIEFDDCVIESTFSHPFYNPEKEEWINAFDLCKGDKVLDSNGIIKEIKTTSVVEVPEGVNVYNFSVSNNHNYYVGSDSILVHNLCDGKYNYLRRKAVDEAWKLEAKNVKNGTSSYSWSKSQMKQLLTKGSVDGYEGAHIIDVHRLIGTKNEYLISDPDNIVFLTHDQHFAAHLNNYKNDTSTEVIIEFLPWAAERIQTLQLVVG